MPRPKQKSRSLRRVYVRTTSGKAIIHYKKKKPKAAHCGECGKPLKGVSRERSNKMKKMGKTKKRVARPYSNLCSKCMRKKIIGEVRKNV